MELLGMVALIGVLLVLVVLLTGGSLSVMNGSGPRDVWWSDGQDSAFEHQNIPHDTGPNVARARR